MKVSLAITAFFFITYLNSFGEFAPYDSPTITSDTIYIPIDLNDCITQLDRIIPDNNKTKIAAMRGDQFSAYSHMTLGMWLRNNWGLWKGSRLSQFFNSKGIHHPDDMSGIVLDSYYRYLTKQEIRLDEQIKYYRGYWEKVKNDELEREEREFAGYHLTDTVLFCYRNGFSSKAQEGKYHNDRCTASGVITDLDKEKRAIKVKLLDGCDKKGIVYYDNDDALIYDSTSGKMGKPRKRIRRYMKTGEENWFKYDEWESTQ